mmetsp:Transcript_3056/g.5455  ORF Transcript_3056/g.5455 Transcript_3056/m.5455 type:complete len:85 (-) Transcript_3056:53-307(-)
MQTVTYQTSSAENEMVLQFTSNESTEDSLLDPNDSSDGIHSLLDQIDANSTDSDDQRFSPPSRKRFKVRCVKHIEKVLSIPSLL